jgi:FkbM family methyltransferase
MLLLTISSIVHHPLNRAGRLRALGRFVRWQIASRLIVGPIALPLVDDTRLLVVRGMRGATGNWYCGLQEHNEMGFLLHFLRKDDVFFDVGANIGSYTIMAAGACGAQTVAFEPIPSTFAALRENVRLNELDQLVTSHNLALGATTGSIQFTSDRDCLNRAIQPGEADVNGIPVAIATLDSIAADTSPTVCKIDVEGFEAQVIAGGHRVLGSLALRCVLIEINGNGRQFGVDDHVIHGAICSYGFTAVRYDALTRKLEPITDGGWNRASDNTIYVRDIAEAGARVRAAKSFKLVNSTL